MAQTFDIRFARSAGFAALLEAPLNRFRWKGGGRLRIDAKGISIGVKRSLTALLGAKHTQHISIESLRSVYREGEALRVEYETEKSTREVLPFWADDRDTAAKIVQLLPTRQTVELEHSTDATQSTRSGSDWRLLLTIGMVVAVIGAASWAIYFRTASPLPGASVEPSRAEPAVKLVEPNSAGAAPQLNAAPALVEAEAASSDDTYAIAAFDTIPEVTTSDVVVLSIPRGTRSREIAVDELAVFEREAAALEYEYRDAHRLLGEKQITPAVFAEKLEELEMGWWKITFRIYDSRQLDDLELLGLRRVMLGAARRWRNFLGEYATALRSGDLINVRSVLSEVARAQEMRARARKYLR